MTSPSLEPRLTAIVVRCAYAAARDALRAARKGLAEYGTGPYALAEQVLPHLLEARHARAMARRYRSGFRMPEGFGSWTEEQRRAFEESYR